MADSKVRLKLLVDTKGQNVPLAEAGKDFIDFLFYLPSLPVGTLVKLLGKNIKGGSLPNLYESIETPGETYMQSNQKKNILLNLRSSKCATDIPLLNLELKTAKVYLCSNCQKNGDDVPNLVCPYCEEEIHPDELIPEDAVDKETVVDGGFVKGTVTYMVMPMSTISIISLLKRFNVKDVGALEERVVDFGIYEGLKLLKASMECKNVLTTVFFENKSA
ncbi:uncharacterized protein LOC116112244 [Pistacia vera]|uniref:uncharacterized protein LOC116112244 n=1 Tax=Pistacia vera TaxID=55513 RepID=UPI001262EB32|nr:uncharacterized protein LOC116112244 [Pistacia vera]